MKILNLYAGVGGNRKLWPASCKVTAVEKDKKIANVYNKLYPDDTIITGDAHQYLLEHYSEFDFIWSSPPCQSHSRMVKATRHQNKRYPDMKLYEEIIFLENFYKGKFVVENVRPYYTPLITPTAVLGRHLVWANFPINPNFEIKQPKNFINSTNLEGRKQMMEWLDIHFDEVIYYENSHCPAQVLRNCVHPKLGEYIINQLL